MSSMNKVFILGRLGKDPEIRYTPSEEPVAAFSVATSTMSTKNGEKKEYTEWHNCVCFNKAAGVAERYLKKGAQVLIEGSLRTTKWEDKGITRYKTEIIVGRLTMLGGKRDSGESSDSIAPMDDMPEDMPF